MCRKWLALNMKNPFGQPIDELIIRGLCDENDIPLLVKACVEHLRRNITVPGILVTDAPDKLTNAIVKRIRAGKAPRFDSLKNVHVAAAVLRVFLEELPVALIPMDQSTMSRSFLMQYFRRSLTQTSRTGEEIYAELRRIAVGILCVVPAIHRRCLFYLLEFFEAVHRDPTNGVNASDIVQIYKPLLTLQRQSEFTFLDSSVIVIEFMIVNISTIKHDLV